MIRRRRRQREIPFSFDSFLDVVANVVGIIIRLILVAWVGARPYSSGATLPRPTHPWRGPPVEVRRAEIGEPEVREPEDPLRRELDQHRRDLAEAQARLLEQLRQLEQT